MSLSSLLPSFGHSSGRDLSFRFVFTLFPLSFSLLSSFSHLLSLLRLFLCSAALFLIPSLFQLLPTFLSVSTRFKNGRVHVASPLARLSSPVHATGPHHSLPSPCRPPLGPLPIYPSTTSSSAAGRVKLFYAYRSINPLIFTCQPQSSIPAPCQSRHVFFTLFNTLSELDHRHVYVKRHPGNKPTSDAEVLQGGSLANAQAPNISTTFPQCGFGYPDSRGATAFETYPQLLQDGIPGLFQHLCAELFGPIATPRHHDQCTLKSKYFDGLQDLQSKHVAC